MVQFKGRSLSIFTVTTIFFAFSFIAVCLRIYVRLRLVKAFKWDDGLMVMAVGSITFAVTSYPLISC
jgi:cation-transporting ATPase 13A1